MKSLNKKYILEYIATIVHPDDSVKPSTSFIDNNHFWEIFVRLGSEHLILPAIYGAIVRKKIKSYFPSDLLEYLTKIYKINTNRNIEILKQISFVVNILNSNHIEYVFLKGSAALIYNEKEILNERMIGDIDILISKKDIEKTNKILISKGFFTSKNNEFSFAGDLIHHRHLNRLNHNDYIASIELHSNLLKKKYDYKLLPSIFLFDKFKINNVWVPSRFNLYKHFIFSWFYNDNGKITNYLQFKTILDILSFASEKNNIFSEKNIAAKSFYGIVSIFFKGYKSKLFFRKNLHIIQLNSKYFNAMYRFYVKCYELIEIINVRLTLLINSKIFRERLWINHKYILIKLKNYWSDKSS